MPAAATSFPLPAWRRDDLPALLMGALVWVLVVLMIVPEGLDYGSLDTTGSPPLGSATSRALWLALLVLGTTMLLMRSALAIALLRRLNPLLLPIVLLAVLSIAWSIDPALSARRVYRLVTITVVAVAFGLGGWHAQRLQRVLRPILTLLLLGSVVFAIAAPALAIHQESASELAGAWRGLANHKNGFGALACTTLLLWVHAGLARQTGGLRAIAGAALALACLLLSRSSTSAAAAVAGVLFMAFALRAPPLLRAAVPALAGLLAAALLVYALGVLDLVPGSATLLASIAAFSDKGTTLTGRTEIWAIVLEHVRQSPWLGTGYGAYWTAAPVMGSDAYEIVRRLDGFYPGSAHNGYLEIANDLGLAGLAGLVGYALLHVRHALRLWPIDPAQATLLLALYFQQAIGNLAETRWFSVLSVDFVFMTLASAALARGLLEQRLQQRFGVPAAQGIAHGA